MVGWFETYYNQKFISQMRQNSLGSDLEKVSMSSRFLWKHRGKNIIIFLTIIVQHLFSHISFLEFYDASPAVTVGRWEEVNMLIDWHTKLKPTGQIRTQHEQTERVSDVSHWCLLLPPYIWSWSFNDLWPINLCEKLGPSQLLIVCRLLFFPICLESH